MCFATRTMVNRQLRTMGVANAREERLGQQPGASAARMSRPQGVDN